MNTRNRLRGTPAPPRPGRSWWPVALALLFIVALWFVLPTVAWPATTHSAIPPTGQFDAGERAAFAAPSVDDEGRAADVSDADPNQSAVLTSNAILLAPVISTTNLPMVVNTP